MNFSTEINRISKNIFTTVTKTELSKLSELASNRKICVEIGSYLGASACAITENFKPDQILYCIDIWESNTEMRPDPPSGTLFENFLINIKDRNVFPIKDYSKNAMNYFIENDIKIDFLFIDGDHTEEGVLSDWNYYYPLMNKGGIVIFHDFGWQSVKRVVDQIRNKLHYFNSLPNMCWGII